MRFLVVSLITTVFAAKTSTRLRQPSRWAFPNRGVNLVTQAVDSTQIQSPAEMEEEEETIQDVPASRPALPVAMDDPPDVPAPTPQAVPAEPAAPTPQAVSAAPASTPDVVPEVVPEGVPEPETPPVTDSAPASQPNEKENSALLQELGVTPVYQGYTAPSVSVGSQQALGELPAYQGHTAPSVSIVSPPLFRNRKNSSSSVHLANGRKTELEVPKDPGIYALDEHKVCNPPCKANRGVCNDKICFCKTPFTGTTCQHEISAGSYRFGPTLVVGSSVVSVLLGSLCANIVYSFIRESIEKRMVSLGDETVNKESWTPSDTGTKRKGRK